MTSAFVFDLVLLFLILKRVFIELFEKGFLRWVISVEEDLLVFLEIEELLVILLVSESHGLVRLCFRKDWDGKTSFV